MSQPMTRYSDAELEAMLRDLESDLVERKESFRGNAPGAIRDAVCAFANDLPDHRRAGVIFLGARDDGAPANLAITDSLLVQLGDLKTDGNILPPPTLSVAKRQLLGVEMAVVTVEPADSPPVRFKGRILIRIDPRRGIASAQDERILNEKRRHRDIPFDLRDLPSARLEDLNLRYFEEAYLPAAFAPEVLEANDRTHTQRLAATKMIRSADDPTPTVLGALVLGRRPVDWIPGAYLQFLRIGGTEPGDPILDEMVVEGKVQTLLERTEDKLASHNRVTVDFTSGRRETRKFLFPPVALQQIVRNAVMHRSYEATHAPIRVYWYDDRIEIQSPGGAFGLVNPETFGEPGLADYRNPNLSEALSVLGFVQRFGFGISISRRELEKNGNPDLEFRVRPSFVAAVLKAPL